MNQLELTPAQQQQQAAAQGPSVAGTAGDAEGRRSDRWRVRHEGLAARGKGISDLPATLRVVNESACEGCDVLGFWRALGFEHAYSMIKEGSLYRCFVILRLPIPQQLPLL